MSRNHVGLVSSLCTALAAVTLVSGCATKGYVNDRIDESQEANRREFEAVKTETAQLRNSTEDALARAGTAAENAEEARALALGKAGLEEVNRYTVYFAFNSDAIDEAEVSTIDSAVSEIRDHPEVIIDVYGFADPTGPDNYNLDLGHRRAMEVVRRLASAAPNQLSRFAAVSFGERDLAGMAPDSDESARSRRVVVSLLRRIPLEDMTPPTAQNESSY